MPTVRHQCRYFGTHSNLHLQAVFAAMFPHSDWTIMTQMISFQLALIRTI